MDIPDWAAEIRMSKFGIIFGGVVFDCRHAGPYRLARDFDNFWNVLISVPGSHTYRTYSGCWGFLKARWRATRHFMFKLVEHVQHPDVTAFSSLRVEPGDWLTFKVLADKLADLDYNAESQLVRHFIPKGV